MIASQMEIGRGWRWTGRDACGSNNGVSFTPIELTKLLFLSLLLLHDSLANASNNLESQVVG